MPQDNFEEALRFVLGNEGGYYAGNEARDPNPTNFGVTQTTYDNFRQKKGIIGQPVKKISMDEVKEIYRGYWEGAGCNWLSPFLAVAMFDHSINAGPSVAVKMFQKAMNLTADGVIGPNTRAAMEATRWLSVDADRLASASVCFERLRFYKELARTKPHLLPNLPSWVMRVIHFADRYL